MPAMSGEIKGAYRALGKGVGFSLKPDVEEEISLYQREKEEHARDVEARKTSH